HHGGVRTEQTRRPRVSATQQQALMYPELRAPPFGITGGVSEQANPVAASRRMPPAQSAWAKQRASAYKSGCRIRDERSMESRGTRHGWMELIGPRRRVDVSDGKDTRVDGE